jgi:7-cyano-7-deazaguanine synthase
VKTVVLVSGGLDSSVLLYLLKREHSELMPIHVDYGQLAERWEWLALGRFCMRARLPPPLRVGASGLGKVPSGLTRSSKRWERDPFYPGRNLLLASIGGAFGYSRGYRSVAIGLVANALYPDQTKEFLSAAQAALSESTGAKFQVSAPLLKLSKVEVVKLGKSLGAPIALTYSCQRGAAQPCGRCSSCKDRAMAMSEARRPHPQTRRVRRSTRRPVS